jgi:hypothetical protein
MDEDDTYHSVGAPIIHNSGDAWSGTSHRSLHADSPAHQRVPALRVFRCRTAIHCPAPARGCCPGIREILSQLDSCALTPYSLSLSLPCGSQERSAIWDPTLGTRHCQRAIGLADRPFSVPCRYTIGSRVPGGRDGAASRHGPTFRMSRRDARAFEMPRNQ